MKPVKNLEDKAVSPIIATILLVAITVVLAATLYTILGGFTNFLSASTPSAAVNYENLSNGDYRLFVNEFSSNVNLSLKDVNIELTTTNGSTVDTSLYNPPVMDGFNITVAGGDLFTSATIITITQASTGPIHYVTTIRLVDTKSDGVMWSSNSNS